MRYVLSEFCEIMVPFIGLCLLSTYLVSIAALYGWLVSPFWEINYAILSKVGISLFGISVSSVLISRAMKFLSNVSIEKPIVLERKEKPAQ